jgi:SOUL heme-binding protein
MGIVFGRISVEVPPFDLILSHEAIQRALDNFAVDAVNKENIATVSPTAQEIKNAMKALQGDTLQVRQYGPTISASCPTGSDDLSTQEGFRVIANYIFGQNTSVSSFTLYRHLKP